MPNTPHNTPRDALGRLCLFLHVGIVLFIVSGWALRPVLIFYLALLPLMVLQWYLNQGTCVLNNLESLIRTGRWRDPSNREEGAWLKLLIHDVTGLSLTVGQVDRIAYSIIGVLWALALWHLLGW